MRYITYPFFCGLVGTIFGIFIGSIFNIQYTKKSFRETQSAIFGILGGGIGLFGGIALGIKLADEETQKLKKEKEQKEKQIAYEKSLISTECKYCNSTFKFSSIAFTKKDYCDKCTSQIRREYNYAITELENQYSDILKLQRKSAILKRLDKCKFIINNILKYEEINLSFVTVKPSELKKKLDEFYKKYS